MEQRVDEVAGVAGENTTRALCVSRTWPDGKLIYHYRDKQIYCLLLNKLCRSKGSTGNKSDMRRKTVFQLKLGPVMIMARLWRFRYLREVPWFDSNTRRLDGEAQADVYQLMQERHSSITRICEHVLFSRRQAMQSQVLKVLHRVADDSERCHELQELVDVQLVGHTELYSSDLRDVGYLDAWENAIDELWYSSRPVRMWIINSVLTEGIFVSIPAKHRSS